MFAHMISLDTSLEGKKNPEMAAYLAGLFRGAGFPEADIHTVPFEDTASLVVRYRGDGSGGRPILLLGHMDVVSARRSDWERDPFTLIEENGFFFGRGTADMKAGITHIAATALRLKANGFVPTRDLILVFTGDEETSGATSRMLLSAHRDLVDGEFALNADSGGGELENTTGAPVAMYVQTAEKSFASYVWTVRNPGGHSSRPRADNAIYDLGDALDRLRAYQFPVMWNDTTLESFRAAAATTPGAAGQAMLRFAERPGEARAARILALDPSISPYLRTTCVPTLLEAGHADNALPQSASATINCRIFPGITIQEMQDELQQVAGPNVEVRLRDPEYWSSPASPLREDVMAAVTKAVQALYPGARVAPSMSAGASDGVFFRGAGIPTYGVSGIFIKSEDDFAHGLNERIPVQSFYDGLVHWDVLITTLAGRS